MGTENYVIVFAAGKQLDLLRGEASRIAKAAKAGWWTDWAEVGTKFCFEDAKARNSFALACDGFGIACRES
ncbi:hypothetical protein [Bradyrhizobium centrosematis]|jgi:hypothetical protein|uniref:hypothetical protein n=1 Tax=Bradyrhizobium centrosematis TaxID=1300039 RepID=UPI0021673249|nr:hypothetical protein [Bradyrhizobium centrosematis]MCS3758738.1 hypothetical protein [Bradyrhizobium centrosematis]MCS3773374.1 hypothetical protein [Bradyrhizobium centrosematis]